MARYLYSELANMIAARKNCAPEGHYQLLSDPEKGAITGPYIETKPGNPEWFDRHTETIESLVRQHLPSGSGFNNGTTIDLDESHADRLVFRTSFHHMNGNGYYDGWTEHTVTVVPSLARQFHLRISGRDRNDIKDYIHQAFDYALRVDVTYDLFLPRFPELAITFKWEEKNGEPSQCYQAWYCNGERFWNDPEAARAYAAKTMEAHAHGSTAAQHTKEEA